MTDAQAPTLRPPSGEPPPEWGSGPDGQEIDLRPLARETCRRYRVTYPDELARYGEAGHAWCVHDNLYLLQWACEDVAGYLDMTAEVAWLARVLESRAFPLERLVASLEIAADVVLRALPPESGTPVAVVLSSAARYVASHGTFLR